MLTATPTLSTEHELPPPAGGFLRWLRTHRGAVAVAGLLAFAGPLTFFTGALSVMRAPTGENIARLGLWWTAYGAALWGLLLVAGYACERVVRGFGRHARAGSWLLAAAAAAGLAHLVTAGRATILIEQGLVHSAPTMHLYGFTFSLIMALLYFAHLRRSREHERAAARLAAAQAAQRRARRRIVEARLQEVQARIDPQLLFKLLDTMRRLYATDAGQAERFLDELIAFLRAALPRLRSDSSSLLRETELARAFAGLCALAGAEGLEMTVDIAPDAMHARFPPGVLLPLLDSALARGAGPCRLTALRLPGGCRLVLSTGAPPSGAAVARVHSLLKELYGTAGNLGVEHTPDTVSVTVEIPYELA